MARGVNKVIIIGNLGQDPEIRYTGSGAAVANVSIATNDVWRDKQTGEKQERTEWHRVVFFSRLAEIVGEFLSKGSTVYVEGSLRTRKWQDKNTGADRYSTEIVASEMQMLGGRSGGGGGGGGDDYQYDQTRQRGNVGGGGVGAAAAGAAAGVAAGAAAGAAAAGPVGGATAADDFDDDIPF